MVIQAIQRLTSAFQGNIAPETKRQKQYEGLATKIAAAKASVAKEKGAMKPNTDSPRGTPCHTTSKGDRAKSKGGVITSKGD